MRFPIRAICYGSMTNYDNTFTGIVSGGKKRYNKENRRRFPFMDRNVNIKRIVIYCAVMALIFLVFGIVTRITSSRNLPAGAEAPASSSVSAVESEIPETP